MQISQGIIEIDTQIRERHIADVGNTAGGEWIETGNVVNGALMKVGMSLYRGSECDGDKRIDTA
ncbi:hypothetical protein CR155_13570 [Pollutimonas nitritireducens]|uniref:Uncharacterized protein n=1 Tax=Pollutimonas nitritireducens TaxID=2045209 RepID=A0A2N4UE54_9BURK|nr:hypothetical protein [Pollutimonas nitritireducens]PLC53304.1 hypothetical protein CR155_13570 [Pollutimonas nitritireducens]